MNILNRQSHTTKQCRDDIINTKWANSYPQKQNRKSIMCRIKGKYLRCGLCPATTSSYISINPCYLPVPCHYSVPVKFTRHKVLAALIVHCPIPLRRPSQKCRSIVRYRERPNVVLFGGAILAEQNAVNGVRTMKLQNTSV